LIARRLDELFLNVSREGREAGKGQNIFFFAIFVAFARPFLFLQTDIAQPRAAIS
jgi:hypothetical protein